tara:strand:+ start:129 stop:947 length:819 start_codon:yes stop_codon:yes gene_type:complete
MSVTASFTYVATGNSVTFTDTSVAVPASDDTSIVGWAWTFGDGNTSTDQNPNHIYVNEGPYVVQLTVTGDAEGTDTTTQTVTVTSESTPVGGVVGSTICCRVPPSLCGSACASLFVEKWQNYLANQKSPILTGADIIDQAQWEYLENVFIGELAVYEIIMAEGSKYMASTNLIFDPASDGGSGTKMIKTGPDEVEWWNNQDNQVEFFKTIMTEGGALDIYKEHLCATAERIGFYVPFCKSKNLGNLFKKAGRPNNTAARTYVDLPPWINNYN